MGNTPARLSALCVVILLLIIFLRRWRQPYLVAYILAGIVLGPGMAALFVPDKGPAELGEFGIPAFGQSSTPTDPHHSGGIPRFIFLKSSRARYFMFAPSSSAVQLITCTFIGKPFRFSTRSI